MQLNRTGWARAALAAFALTATCVIAAPAGAADYRMIVLDGHTMSWSVPAAAGSTSITYAIVASQRTFAGARNCRIVEPLDRLLGANNIARATFEHELDAAFTAWSRVANIRFRKVDAPDADILIGAQATPAGRAFTNVEYSDPGSSTERVRLTRSVICLNPEQPWKVGFDGNLEVYDIRYALTHEIGHAIGLDHPGRTGELMDFHYREDFRVPQLGDIAGATALYGPSPLLTAAGAGVTRKVSSSTELQ